MLTRHVVGPDGVGKDIKLSPEEEAAVRAEWAANDAKPKPKRPVPVEDRIAALEQLLVEKAIVSESEIQVARSSLGEKADAVSVKEGP